MSESPEKAVALTKIPRGSRSSSFLLEDVCNIADASLTFPIQVGIWTSGEIQPLNKSLQSIFWPKLIKIAPDCHVQNVKLSRCTLSEVILQATKDINQGEELLIWFGEDLLADEMGIPPYLNPTNIRGGNSYVCQDCSKEFEAPNYLKIHIALKCSTLSKGILWTRLSSCNKSQSPSSLTNFLPHSPFSIKTHPNNMMPILIPPPQMSLLPPNITVQSFQELSSLPTSKHGSSVPNQQHQQQHPLNNENGRSLCLNVEKSTSDPQAQLESIVSNMGKARNGHMCLYCGKLYSRKYGLKIHIRTHTGYKPLRCRICHRPFGDPSNLNKHIRLHSDGNTPYRCDICNKVLVRKRDLERHIRSRHTNTVSSLVLDCTLNNRTSSSTTSLSRS